MDRKRVVGILICGGLVVALGGRASAQALSTSAPMSPSASTGVSSAAEASVVALDAALTRTAAEVSPKVVVINSGTGLGSGEILDARGYIVTNYHVLSGGGANLTPAVLGRALKRQDLQGNRGGHGRQRRPGGAEDQCREPEADHAGDSSKLRVGQLVLAIGNPLGYAQTVTFGIVSTLGRGLPEGQPAAFLPDLIQTSAPINPGNSGGALVDLQGGWWVSPPWRRRIHSRVPPPRASASPSR